MKEKFDCVLNQVQSVHIGPPEKINDVTTFDIHIRTASNYHFSMRCVMANEVTEDSGIFYYGLKGKSNE